MTASPQQRAGAEIFFAENRSRGFELWSQRFGLMIQLRRADATFGIEIGIEHIDIELIFDFDSDPNFDFGEVFQKSTFSS
jgi:hypothetical protein